MSFASARVTTAFRRDTRARPDRGAAAGRSAVACGQREAGLGQRGTKHDGVLRVGPQRLQQTTRDGLTFADRRAGRMVEKYFA